MEITKWVFFCLVVILGSWFCLANCVLTSDKENDIWPGDGDVRPDEGVGKSGTPYGSEDLGFGGGASGGISWGGGHGAGEGMPLPSRPSNPVPPSDGQVCSQLCNMCTSCGKAMMYGYNMPSVSEEGRDAPAEEPPAGQSIRYAIAYEPPAGPSSRDAIADEPPPSGNNAT